MNTMETSPTQTPETLPKKEGKTTALIESQTSKVPSGTYLALAIGSMVVSAVAMATGRKQIANFIGQWAPSLLVIGLYNKVVKLEDEILSQRQGGGAGSF